jgi:hypothetical protein
MNANAMTRIVPIAAIICGAPGCPVPIPIQVLPVTLPGWGETYSFRRPDGTVQDGGFLIVEYIECPGRAAKLWGVATSKRELYVLPIAAGTATMPRKTVWKSKWAMGVDGCWHPDSTTQTYVLVQGVRPLDSGPGHWFHGFEVGAIWPSDSPYARFGSIAPEHRLNCELVHTNQPQGKHLELLARLANARETFHGYRLITPEPDALKALEHFAKQEMDRWAKPQ